MSQYTSTEGISTAMIAVYQQEMVLLFKLDINSVRHNINSKYMNQSNAWKSHCQNHAMWSISSESY